LNKNQKHIVMKKIYLKSFLIVFITLSFNHLNAQWTELGGLNTFANSWNSGQISNISVSPTTNNIFAGGDFGTTFTREVSRYVNADNAWSRAGTFNANCNIYDFEIIPSIGSLAGGCFTNTNGETYITRFDGTNWTQLGNTLGQGSVNEICTNLTRTAAYVGGPTNVSGKVYVATWNGSSWVELGGTNSLSSILGASTQQIFTVCTDPTGNVYAAGSLYGTTGGNRIAKYNGTSWSFITGSFSGTIYDIKSDLQGNIYVAGTFTNSSNKYYVAKFNGTSWSELGGLNGLSANCSVSTLAIDKFGNIYAAGCFTNTSNKRYVAKFSGNLWAELGGNNSLAANGNILTLAVDTLNNILAAGDFTNSSGNKYVAKYACQINTPTITANGPTNFCIGGSVILTSSSTTGNNWSNGATTNSINVTTSGSYSVSVTSGGCSATSNIISVNVNPIPSVSINTLTNNAMISKSASQIVLSGTPSGGNFSGFGVINNIFYPNNAQLGTNVISYNYSSTAGCSGYSTRNFIVYDTIGNFCSVTDTLIINVSTTGLNPPNNVNTINVYPNPASDCIIIDNGNYGSMNGYTIKIINSLGQQVFQNTINQQQFIIDLSTWNSNGIYFLHLINAQNNTVTIRKIILQ
jgi:hypothetical protein